MRIKQYVFFAIGSDTVSAVEIATHLGLEPDRSSVRGSKHEDPPVPRSHFWDLVCDQAGLRIDEQIADVMSRIRPLEARIAGLLAKFGSEVSCSLRIIRYFNHPDGEPEELDRPDAPLQKLPGQHQLLGLGLDIQDIELLARLGAFLDVDEYEFDPFEGGTLEWMPHSS